MLSASRTAVSRVTLAASLSSLTSRRTGTRALRACLRTSRAACTAACEGSIPGRVSAPADRRRARTYVRGFTHTHPYFLNGAALSATRGHVLLLVATCGLLLVPRVESLRLRATWRKQGVSQDYRRSINTRSIMLTASSGETARLGQLWRGACEVMLQVPRESGGKSDVCLVPLESLSSTQGTRGELPAALRNNTVMALTAFDPPGTSRDRAENAAANKLLWEDIMQLSIAPTCAWQSYGFDLEEGWREDGFCLAFARADADAARHQVLELAKKYDQGAIFQYVYDEGEKRLWRNTLGACLDMADVVPSVLAAVDMSVVAGHPLVALPWAGPSDGGILP